MAATSFSVVRFGEVWRVPVIEVSYLHVEEEVRQRILQSERKITKGSLSFFSGNCCTLFLKSIYTKIPLSNIFRPQSKEEEA